MVRIFELNAQYGCFSDRLACELLIVLNLSLFLQPLDFEQTLWNRYHAFDFVFVFDPPKLISWVNSM